MSQADFTSARPEPEQPADLAAAAVSVVDDPPAHAAEAAHPDEAIVPDSTGSATAPATLPADTPDPAEVPAAASGHRRIDLPGTPSAVTIGRDFTRQALTDWGWIPAQPDPTRQTVAADILLVVSEVLANAVMHAGGARAIAVDDGAATGAFRLEVVDGDPAPPVPPAEHRPGLPGGHGLLIVAKLTDRWGVISAADGKTVWAEVDLTRLAGDLAAPPTP